MSDVEKQGPRGPIDLATENTVVQCDGFNAPDCTRAVISEFLHQAKAAVLSLVPSEGVDRKSTGMHDEDGREIFEGDWVQFNVTFFDGNFKDEPISGKIVYVPELMSFQLVNVQSDYWREYTGGDDSTYAPFSELNFTEADFRIIEPPALPTPEEA